MKNNGWHYLAVTKIPTVLRGITSKYDGDFHYLNCLHFSRTKNKLELYKKVRQNRDFCGVAVPSADTKILRV